MQRIAAFVRSMLPDTNAHSPLELNERAREIVNDIDNDTGVRTAHSQRVARLYAVARDIQHAREAGAGEMTTYRLVAFLRDVFVRSYLPKLSPR